jgi:hypothetical protein
MYSKSSSNAAFIRSIEINTNTYLPDARGSIMCDLPNML